VDADRRIAVFVFIALALIHGMLAAQGRHERRPGEAKVMKRCAA